MKKIYVVDTINLFTPKVQMEWEVYSYTEIAHMSQDIKGVTIVVFLTGDIYSVFGLDEKISTIYARISPICIILSDGEKRKIFAFTDLLRLIYVKDTEKRRRLRLLKRINNQIEDLSKPREVTRWCEGNNPIYIKTTMSFGVQAGGAVAHSTGVLTGLEEIFDKVRIYSTDYFPQDIKNGGEFRHISLSGRWTIYELCHLDLNESAYKHIVRWQGNERPGFVYQRYSLYDFLGLRTARYYNVPFVIEYNSSEIWTSKQWGGGINSEYLEIAERIEDLNLTQADLIVCVSEELRDGLIERGINSKKILVNYNGVDEKKYSPKANGELIREKYGFKGKIVIGFCGSYGPFHGAEKLAEAFSVLTSDTDYKSRIRLMMLGEGGTLPQVKRILRNQLIDNVALCVGTVPFETMPEYLMACDILVAPHVRNKDGSEFFGSPTKLFEYMAMGKAIAAADLNQIGSILTDNYNALLFEPGNVKDMVKVIRELVENDSLRERLGRTARQTVVSKYTWKQHVNNIIERVGEL